MKQDEPLHAILLNYVLDIEFDAWRPSFHMKEFTYIYIYIGRAFPQLTNARYVDDMTHLKRNH